MPLLALLTTPAEIAGLVLSYLLGAIPFGLVLARLVKGIDLREIGSGNIGATNTMRALGRGWGVLAFLLDFAKGLVPSLLLAPAFSAEPSSAGWLSVCYGAAAVLGHCFPVYLRFRGGKAVATGCGALVGIDPMTALLGALVWPPTLALSRMVSLASIVMGVGFVAAAAYRQSEVGSEPLVAASLLALLILIRHRQNIARIAAGTESRIGGKGSKRRQDTGKETQ